MICLHLPIFSLAWQKHGVLANISLLKNKKREKIVYLQKTLKVFD
jgi:hypothetical protein